MGIIRLAKKNLMRDLKKMNEKNQIVCINSFFS